MSKLGSQYDFFWNDINYTEKKTDRTCKKWLKCKEATVRYGVSRPTIMKWALKAGSLHRIGETILIDSEALDRFIEGYRIPEGVY